MQFNQETEISKPIWRRTISKWLFHIKDCIVDVDYFAAFKSEQTRQSDSKVNGRKHR
ncbi:MAG: hypothetical protein ACKER6_00020 [Candidatus Hodgkinia cicadicola]